MKGHPQMTQMNADSPPPQNRLRTSATSADYSRSVSPRQIEVYIEELVLRGFPPNDRWRIGDALQGELRHLLETHEVPLSWRNNTEKIDAGMIRLTNPGQTGTQIAVAIHGGGEQ